MMRPVLIAAGIILGNGLAFSDESDRTVCNFAKVVASGRIIEVGDTVDFKSRSGNSYNNVKIKKILFEQSPDGKQVVKYEVEHSGSIGVLDPSRIDENTVVFRDPPKPKEVLPVVKKEETFQERVAKENRSKWIKPNSELSELDRLIRSKKRAKERHQDYAELHSKPKVGSFLEHDPAYSMAEGLPSNFRELAEKADFLMSPEGEKAILKTAKKMRFVEVSKANATSGEARQIFEFKLDDKTVVSYAVAIADGKIESREILIGTKDIDGKFKFAGFAEYPGVVDNSDGKKYFLASTEQNRKQSSLLRHGGSQECMSCHAFDGKSFYSRNAQGPRVQKFFNGEPDGVAPGAQYFDLRGRIATVPLTSERGIDTDIIDVDQVYTAFGAIK